MQNSQENTFSRVSFLIKLQVSARTGQLSVIIHISYYHVSVASKKLISRLDLREIKIRNERVTKFLKNSTSQNNHIKINIAPKVTT